MAVTGSFSDNPFDSYDIQLIPIYNRRPKGHQRQLGNLKTL